MTTDEIKAKLESALLTARSAAADTHTALIAAFWSDGITRENRIAAAEDSSVKLSAAMVEVSTLNATLALLQNARTPSASH